MAARSFLPKEWIMEQWDKGFYITAIAGESEAPQLAGLAGTHAMSLDCSLYQNGSSAGRLFSYCPSCAHLT